MYIGDLWRGEESWRERERERETGGWRFLGVRTKHAKPRHHLHSRHYAPRAFLYQPLQPPYPYFDAHIKLHKGLHMTVDGWRQRISIYQRFLSVLFSCTERLLLLRSSLHPNNAVDRALLNKQYLVHRQRQSPTSYSFRHP